MGTEPITVVLHQATIHLWGQLSHLRIKYSRRQRSPVTGATLTMTATTRLFYLLICHVIVVIFLESIIKITITQEVIRCQKAVIVR